VFFKIELLATLHVFIDAIGLVGSEGFPEGIEEPDGLFLVVARN